MATPTHNAGTEVPAEAHKGAFPPFESSSFGSQLIWFALAFGALGFLGWAGAVLPLGLTMALTALELLVAFLQAYVFAILTCIYLNDALHPGH